MDQQPPSPFGSPGRSGRLRPSPARRAAILTAGLVVLASVAGSQAPPGAPLITVPFPSAGGTSDSFFYFHLGTGRGTVVEQLRRDPTSPRFVTLQQNLFTEIGRAANQAAISGEILIGPIHHTDGSVRSALYVETPIGYVAYFKQLGKGDKLGEIVTVIGRPFESLGAADGNFVLLMRREKSGKTVGAYLYHATTGRAVYCFDISKLDPDLKIQTTSPLPALGAGVTAVPLHEGSEGTSSYLVLDPPTGDIYYFDLSGLTDQFSVRKAGFSLFDAIARTGPVTSSRRFLPIPIRSDDQNTAHLLVLDAVSGEMALIENVTSRQVSPVLRKVSRSLGDVLSASSAGGDRILAAVPNNDGSGATEGAWVLDNLSGTILYIDQPSSPAQLTVRPVSR